MSGGTLTTPEAIADKVRRLRAYFGRNGGITVSGGEPLLQVGFVTRLFEICRSEGISCALDTSGCIYNEAVERLLSLCDIVLLDYKFTSDDDYTDKCGCSKEQVELFLERLEALHKRVWLRHVVIPKITDGEESIKKIYDVKQRYGCIEKIELLPFRKLCSEKYAAMGIEFPLCDTPEADAAAVAELAKRMENNY